MRIAPILIALGLSRAACGQYQQTGKQATSRFSVSESALEDQTCIDRATAMQHMYNSVAFSYDDMELGHEPKANDLIRLAKLRTGQSVLDLACGTGLVAIKAKKRVGRKGRVVGVDISRNMLTIARFKALKAGLHISFMARDINNLDGLSSALGSNFDVIICASGLLLTDDGAKALQNWARFLKPGGRIIFDIPDKRERTDYVAYSLLLEKELPTVSLEHRIESAGSVEEMILKAGLKPYVFQSQLYGRYTYNKQQGLEPLRKALTATFYKCFMTPQLLDEAVRRYEEAFDEKQNSIGEVTDLAWVWIGIATKPL